MSTLERAINIAAPASEVWRVLTTRDLVREWAAVIADEIDVNSNWRLGGRIAWKAPGGYTRKGMIAELAPRKRLRFEYAGDPGSVASEAFEISADGADTRLTLTLTAARGEPAEPLATLADHLLAAIRSLAEELAHIRGLRR